MAKILIIKHGAFGDFIQSVGALRAIRAHHQNDEITLLTTKPWLKLAVPMAENAALFDRIQVDPRKGLWNTLKTIRWIRREKFDFVYDLQNTDRTGLYYKLLRKKPQWSGFVKGCSHPHRTEHRQELHTIDRLKEQLAIAGIYEVPENDVNWLPNTEISVGKPFALLVPGGAPHREKKRWTIEGYSALAQHLLSKNIRPILIGTNADKTQTEAIAKTDKRIADLTNQTSFADIATLARQAALAVGNDTGPMHLISVAGCKTITLYSHDSDPKRCGQRGKDITIIRVEDLQKLALETVLEQLDN